MFFINISRTAFINLYIEWDIQAGVGLRPGKFFVCYCPFSELGLDFWDTVKLTTFLTFVFPISNKC